MTGERPLDRAQAPRPARPRRTRGGNRDTPDCPCAHTLADTSSRRPPAAVSEIDGRKRKPPWPRCQLGSTTGRSIARSAIAGASSPHKTRAGYLTPIAKPANSPATIAAVPAWPFVKPNPGEDGRRAERGQGDVVERGRHAVGHGRNRERDRAGPPGAAAEARPRQRRHIGGEHQAQDPLNAAASDRPAKLERHRIEHLRHQRIDRLMEVGRKPDRSVHQEHLGHLEVIAQRVAVGHRRQRGQCRPDQHQPQAEREEQRQRRPATRADARLEPGPHLAKQVGTTRRCPARSARPARPTDRQN